MRHLIDFSYSLLFSLEIKMPHSFHLLHVLCIINLPSSALPEEFILLQWLKTSLNFLVSFYIIIIFFSLRHSFWSPWFQHPLQEALGKAGCRVVVLASCFPLFCRSSYSMPPGKWSGRLVFWDPSCIKMSLIYLHTWLILFFIRVRKKRRVERGESMRVRKVENREQERESQISSICRFSPQVPATTGTGWGQKQEPGVPSRSPTWAAGPKPWISVWCLLVTLMKTWVGSGGGLLSYTFDAGFGHPKQWFNLQHCTNCSRVFCYWRSW